MRIIGILIDEKVFQSMKRGNRTIEKIRPYNKAAIKHGLTPVYLCLKFIFPSTGKAYGYKYSKGKYKYVNISIPRIIHNRTIPQSKSSIKRLIRLAKSSFVYNSQNRYSKYRIHKLLEPRFTSHLPMTVNYSTTNLRTMMKKHSSLYIKPQNSSLGKGIVKISRKYNNKWRLQSQKRTTIANSKTVEKQVGSIVSKRRYIIQEAIPLAQYRGNPYDIRVTVQRGAHGRWQVTGMFGKIARKGGYVTNVARGGHVKKCSQLFKNTPNKVAVTNAIKRLSLEMTQYMGERLHHLADVGLDIGITSAGKPYFIELNCCDQRYGFKKANMLTTFHKTYENPMLYAKYVLKSRR